MTKRELNKAFKIAKSDIEITEEIDCIDGFGLDGFGPIWITLNQLARLIRWQCFCFDGSIDDEKFQEIAFFGKSRFMIIDP